MAGVVWISVWARRTLRQTPIETVLIALSFGTVSLAAIGGWASFTLHSLGLADYAVSGTISIDSFVRLYLYTVVDLLPGIEVWETLHINPPAEPRNAWAGGPLVVFKVFVIVLVWDTFKRWRSTKDAPDPQSE